MTMKLGEKDRKAAEKCLEYLKQIPCMVLLNKTTERLPRSHVVHLALFSTCIQSDLVFDVHWADPGAVNESTSLLLCETLLLIGPAKFAKFVQIL